MKQKTQANGVQGGNMEALEAAKKTPLGATPYYTLLAEVATMLDSIAAGNGPYMTIGSTMNRNSFMLTIKEHGNSAGAWGNTLLGLIEDM